MSTHPLVVVAAAKPCRGSGKERFVVNTPPLLFTLFCTCVNTLSFATMCLLMMRNELVPLSFLRRDLEKWRWSSFFLKLVFDCNMIVNIYEIGINSMLELKHKHYNIIYKLNSYPRNPPHPPPPRSHSKPCSECHPPRNQSPHPHEHFDPACGWLAFLFHQ